MEISHLPTRRLSVLVLVVVTLTLAACGAGPVGQTPAATAEGRDIGPDKVTDLLAAQQRYIESQADNPGADPQQVADALAGFTGQGEETYDMGEAAAALQSWINYTIVLADIERNGESITDADREAARTDLITQLGGEEALEAVDPELLKFSIDSAASYKALDRVVAAQPSDDREQRLQDLYDEVAPQRPLCLNLIVSETEDDANAALARIEGGEEFGAVAGEVSADPATAANGGFAGCASVEQAAEYFGGDYSTAAAGDVIGPVSMNQLFVLVEVESTTGPSFEQLRPELEQQLAAEDTNRVGEYLLELQANADVTVDPRYGTWDSETGTVTPPQY